MKPKDQSEANKDGKGGDVHYNAKGDIVFGDVIKGNHTVNHYHNQVKIENTNEVPKLAKEEAQTKIRKLEKLFVRAKLNELLDELKTIFKEKDLEHYNEVLQLSMILNNIQKEERLGIRSASEISLSKNKLGMSILSLMDKIKEV